MGFLRLFIVSIISSFHFILSSQELGTIYGTISDTAGYTVGFANVSIQGTKFGITADRYGQFEFKAPKGENTVVFTCVGYKTTQYKVTIEADKKTRIDIILEELFEKVEEVKVFGRAEQTGTLQRIDAKTLSAMPNSTGNIENVIKQLPG
jgi:hypothetical protein